MDDRMIPWSGRALEFIRFDSGTLVLPSEPEVPGGESAPFRLLIAPDNGDGGVDVTNVVVGRASV